MAGRIGETPIIGAVTCHHFCAVCATGDGDNTTHATVARDVAGLTEHKGHFFKNATAYVIQEHVPTDSEKLGCCVWQRRSQPSLSISCVSQIIF